MTVLKKPRVHSLCLTILLCACASSWSHAQSQGQLPEASAPQLSAMATAIPAAASASNSAIVWDADAAKIPDAPQPQQAAAPTPQPDANQSQTQTQTPQTETDAQKRKEQAERDVQSQEKQRIMGIMPAFNSTSNQNAVPLSAGQKIRLSFRSAVDPWQFGITIIAAGLGQAENSHPGYGQGWEGYGKRYAASYADLFDGTVIGNGLLPAALHQDPRYFRMGSYTDGVPNGGWKRFLYAISTNVRCKGDNGKWQPNYSNVGGNIIAGGISEFYYPKSERGVGLVFTNALVVTAEGAIGSELLEFWPDIQRKLFKGHKYTDTYTKAAEDAQHPKTTSPAPPPVPNPAPAPASQPTQ